MKQQLAELVTVILQMLDEQRETPPTKKGMRSWLVRQGYNKVDIDAAIKMVWPEAPSLDTNSQAFGVVRQFSNYEKIKLSPEARLALVRLELYNLIHPHELELLLEHIAQLEGEVALQDIEFLLSWGLFSHRDVETQQTISSIISGSWERH